MLLDWIENFEIFRPKMDSTKETLHAIATFRPDISPSFPYVNAELGGWDYDQINQVLLVKLSDGKDREFKAVDDGPVAVPDRPPQVVSEVPMVARILLAVHEAGGPWLYQAEALSSLSS